MDEINEVLAKNIAEFRRDAGLTQTELAEQLHYSDKLISKWERGDAAPNAAALWQMAEIFSVTVDELYTGRNGSGGRPKRVTDGLTRRQHILIVSIALCGLLTVALLIFDISWILGRPFWRAYLYLLPAGLVVLLVFNSLWNGGKGNCIIVALLLPALLLTVCVSTLPRKSWQLFSLLIPGEFIVYLSWRLGKVSGEE